MKIDSNFLTSHKRGSFPLFSPRVIESFYFYPLSFTVLPAPLLASVPPRHKAHKHSPWRSLLSFQSINWHEPLSLLFVNSFETRLFHEEAYRIFACDGHEMESRFLVHILMQFVLYATETLLATDAGGHDRESFQNSVPKKGVVCSIDYFENVQQWYWPVRVIFSFTASWCSMKRSDYLRFPFNNFICNLLNFREPTRHEIIVDLPSSNEIITEEENTDCDVQRTSTRDTLQKLFIQGHTSSVDVTSCNSQIDAGTWTRKTKLDVEYELPQNVFKRHNFALLVVP